MFNGELGKMLEGTAAVGQEQLCRLGCVREHQCLRRVAWDQAKLCRY